jgi:hypothetical protein
MIKEPVKIFACKQTCFLHCLVQVLFLIFVLQKLAIIGCNYAAIIFIAALGSCVPLANIYHIFKNKPDFILTAQGIEFKAIGLVKWQQIECMQEVFVIRPHRGSNYWLQINLKQDLAPEQYRTRIWGLLMAVVDVESSCKIRIYPYLNVAHELLIKQVQGRVRS